ASDSQTTADSGASDGGSLTLTAVVALNVDNITTTANVGSGSADLTLAGKLDGKANQTAKSKTVATGATKGGNLTIGASLALTFGNHHADSSLYRNATAQNAVSFQADGSSDTDTEATASAAGAKDESSDSSTVNDKGDQQAQFGNTKST